jgi:hypothetical protein
LVLAYWSTWDWSRELMAKLSARHAFPLPDSLLTKLNRYVKGA